MEVYNDARFCQRGFIFRYRLQEFLSNAAEAFNNCGMYDSAKICSKHSLSEIDSAQNLYPDKHRNFDDARAIAFDNLGNSYRILKQYDSSENYYNNSVLLLKKADNNQIQLLTTLLHLANLYLNQGNSEKAERVLQEYDQALLKGLGTHLRQDSLMLAADYCDLRWKYYDGKGDAKTAIDYLKMHHQLKEAEWTEDISMLNSETPTGMHNAYDDLKIADLKRDSEIKNSRLVSLALGILLLVVGILLALAYLRAYRRTQRVKHLENEKLLYESKLEKINLRDRLTLNQLNLISLIENTDDFLWSVDKDFKYLAFNKSYANFIKTVTGIEPQTGMKDILSTTNPVLFSRIETAYQAALDGRIFYNIDKGHNINGYIPDIEVRTSPIRNSEGTIIGISCFRRDITNLLQIQSDLERKNENLSSIAWTQSHKLRGPLATIKGIVDFLQQAQIDEVYKAEMIEDLKRTVNEMDDVIHEIVKQAES
jgi:PAS domain-containing protein